MVGIFLGTEPEGGVLVGLAYAPHYHSGLRSHEILTTHLISRSTTFHDGLSDPAASDNGLLLYFLCR